MSEDVLDALEADLEVVPAAAKVVAHLIDFVVPVRNRFAVLDFIEGDIRSGMFGSTVKHGDVEGFPVTDEDGRGQVGKNRCALVPAESQSTPQFVQDEKPPSMMPVTTTPASSDTVWRLLFCPISTKGAHLRVR